MQNSNSKDATQGQASIAQSTMLCAASLEELLKDVSVCYSRGRGKSGSRANFIRPADDCFNKSRRVTGFTDEELDEKIIATVKKWYYPMKYYKVDGHIIGSNSEENALKEYYRVCDVKDKLIVFPVTLAQLGCVQK